MNTIRQIVGVLNRLPYNSPTARVIHKLADKMKNGPVKTRAGFLMSFQNTNKMATFVRKLMLSGSYEREDLQMIKRFVKPGDYVVDVGAHEGYITLSLSQRVGSEGRVFAIEPNPNNLNYLYSNVKLNAPTAQQGTNIDVFEKAVGSKSQKKPFYYSNEFGAWGSLGPFSHLTQSKTLEIEVDRLDNILKDIKQLDFVKVDVEGHELDVFLGAEETLARYNPHICFEVNLTFWSELDHSVDSLFTLLRNKGYELFVLKDGQLNEYEWLNERVMNMFAVHSSRKHELRERGIIDR